MSTQLTRDFGTDPGVWLLGLGIAAIIGAFFLASRVLVLYSMELFLYTGAYIALQVGGWLALLIWYLSR